MSATACQRKSWGVLQCVWLSGGLIALWACGDSSRSGPTTSSGTPAQVSGTWTLNVALAPSCSGRLPAGFMNRSWQGAINQSGAQWAMNVQNLPAPATVQGVVSARTLTIQVLAIGEVLANGSYMVLLQGEGTVNESSISGTLNGEARNLQNPGQSCNAVDHRFSLTRR
jgi:hypothetical protein